MNTWLGGEGVLGVVERFIVVLAGEKPAWMLLFYLTDWVTLSAVDEMQDLAWKFILSLLRWQKHWWFNWMSFILQVASSHSWYSLVVMLTQIKVSFV